jgi:hypothetical protein
VWRAADKAWRETVWRSSAGEAEKVWREAVWRSSVGEVVLEKQRRKC